MVWAAQNIVEHNMRDEKVDLVVCFWNPERGIGTARDPEGPNNGHDGVFFMWTDIVTTGEETLHAGSKIYARLIPDPKFPQEKLKAVDIEIYQEVPANV
jgi:hypothetical protein